MIYEYLLFNIFITSGPLLAILLNRKEIIKPNFKSLVVSILTAASFFVFWDMLVVNYFWFFNNNYITGLFIFNLPIEEILFFFSVPFACLLLWVNYKKYFTKKISSNFPIYLITICLLLATLLFFDEKFYSASVLLVFSGVTILDIVLKTRLFIQQSFITFVFLSVNLLTFIFNLYLTARPIISYNSAVKTNINIITVPIEDFVFGMALISLVIIIYNKVTTK